MTKVASARAVALLALIRALCDSADCVAAADSELAVRTANFHVERQYGKLQRPMSKIYPVIGVAISGLLIVAGAVLVVLITCVWRVFAFVHT